jgi:RNA polymerase-binding transcription factor
MAFTSPSGGSGGAGRRAGVAGVHDGMRRARATFVSRAIPTKWPAPRNAAVEVVDSLHAAAVHRMQGFTVEEPMDDVQARLSAERDQLIEELRRLHITPEADAETATRPLDPEPLDVGDRSQVSERQDLEFAVRERLADRINRLSAALDRVTEGQYGVCERCGRPIEPARLSAVPDATTCLGCQRRIEREGGMATPSL